MYDANVRAARMISHRNSSLSERIARRRRRLPLECVYDFHASCVPNRIAFEDLAKNRSSAAMRWG